MTEHRSFPGLISEELPSGKIRYRVRVDGNPKRRITLTVAPDHFDFLRQYHNARAGETTETNPISGLKETAPLRTNISKILRAASIRAKQKNYEFNLTYENIIGMLEKQQCRCAISNIKFDLRPTEDGTRRPFTMSIDRVNNSAGYTTENCRLVCTIVNIARSNWKDEHFTHMCHQVAENNPKCPA